MDLVTYPNPVLRMPTSQVSPGTDLTKIIAEMRAVMQINGGIGIAAPQVGLSLDLFIAQDKVYINAVLSNLRGRCGRVEACLSIPGIRYLVMRPEQITVKAYNDKWELVEFEAEGLAARVICHESDHCRGVLFIDYIPPGTRRLLMGE